MNISASSLTSAMNCWQKTFNVYHRQLTSTNYNLIDGGATHDGIAHGLATKNWVEAIEVAKTSFAKKIEEYEWKMELDPVAVAHEALVVEMVKAFATGYKDEDYLVLQPECRFDFPIPGSEHNCIFKHWEVGDQEFFDDPDPKDLIDHLPNAMGGPSADDILARRVMSPHHFPDPTCRCWTPHRAVGTTDAIVRWNRAIWLLEHKTSAISGEQFWASFRIDVQPTFYLYGISRSLKFPVNGFIVNQIFKPSEKQVANWNSRRKYGPSKDQSDYINFSREAFLRTDQDLIDLEQDIVRWANEWEQKIVSGWFPKSNIKTTCMSYRRPCQFMELCTHGGKDESLIDALRQSLEGVKTDPMEVED